MAIDFVFLIYMLFLMHSVCYPPPFKKKKKKIFNRSNRQTWLFLYLLSARLSRSDAYLEEL